MVDNEKPRQVYLCGCPQYKLTFWQAYDHVFWESTLSFDFATRILEIVGQNQQTNIILDFFFVLQTIPGFEESSTFSCGLLRTIAVCDLFSIVILDVFMVYEMFG